MTTVRLFAAIAVVCYALAVICAVAETTLDITIFGWIACGLLAQAIDRAIERRDS